MKNLRIAFAILALCFAVTAFAQSPTPTPTGAAVVVAAASSPGFLSSAWTFLNGQGGAYLFAALFAVSELLANCFPALAANSVWELFTKGLQQAEAKNPAPQSPS